MEDLDQTLQCIWQAYSGETAWQTVAELCRFHRIQASPGYRQAAELIHRRLARAGLDAETLSFPADDKTSFWSWSSFQEWECSEASLQLVAPADEARVLADFRANAISVIQRSFPVEGEFEVVLLEDGLEEEDYQGLELEGRVVLTCGDLRPVWERAVQERGAAGILFDGMRPVLPVRPEGDLSDVRQYTSFWWRPGDTGCFGFVLTPRQGRELRKLLAKSNRPDTDEGAQDIRIRARVVSLQYDGALEVVSSAIPGEIEQEIVVVAHLCHPRPSANDNASGAAAALEAALVLNRLIAEGALPTPRRSIRFLWLPEMTGSVAYLSDREAELERFVAGLNLDMVGQDQEQTGSSWLIERPPDAAASFAPDLLVKLRDQLPVLKGMADVSPSHTGLGAYPLYRQAEVPFSGGSDHFVFSDPTVGVPMPMLIQWPDRFYHTSADTPDRTSPQSLARAGTLAAAYAYWLATAGSAEATWLGYQMLSRFKARVVDAAQAAIDKVLGLDEGDDLARAVLGLDRRLAYLLDRLKTALATLERLAPVDCLDTDLQAEAESVLKRELYWARGAIGLRAVALGLKELPMIPPLQKSDEEEQASKMVPQRLARGPIPLHDHLRHLEKEEREAWQALVKERKGRAYQTQTALALYWVDGSRSVLEIIDLVELETGHRDVELLLHYFRLLEKLDLVSLQ
jgi:aminopeptidase-like protein